MDTYELDEVDKGILYHLQQDARNSTSTEMAGELDIAASTVRNRLARMEDEGVIERYIPQLDYEKAGFQLRVLFTCTAPDEPENFGQDVLEQEGVIAVRELLAGTENLHVEAVGTDTDQLTEIADSLREMGLEIVRSDILKAQLHQPFNHFGVSAVTDDEGD
ncbi:Lrp/AsnC family transcriptional regulator [Halorussus sp. MSC15.2]|uniref:Lrp/AsnC family transcriptional regulator n=1 Tax=Halorussus sp. MSC15.2 TaxID=2283638 RepID=UPI0013D620B7|nr:Lrp/AsnC family transcriptional regulator [Halorussus sp. MSC15.2]NEU57401.1 Lrp/AsnC family transcriptional regulator [Halorussus sp. MSC15.2]